MKYPLTLRLVLWLVAYGTFLTLISGLFFSQMERKDALANLQQRLDDILMNAAAPIAEDLWYVRETSLHHHLEDLLQLPNMAMAKVEGQDGLQVIEKKEQTFDHLLTSRATLQHHTPTEKITVGTLTIQAEADSLHRKARLNFFYFAGIEAVRMLIIAMLLWWMISRLLTRHLAHLANYANQLDFNTLDKELSLNRKDRQDELQWVVNAINNLRTSLQEEIEANQQLSNQYRIDKERAQTTLLSIGEAVVTTDSNGLVEMMNPKAEQLLGIDSNTATGKPLTEVIVLKKGDAPHNELVTLLQQVVQKNTALVSEDPFLLQNHQHHSYYVNHCISPIRDQQGTIDGVVLVLQDITEARALSAQIERQAMHDPLTDLINRREFENRLKQALRTARIDKLTHHLIYMDLDQFKVVNDTCGHVAGDELLRQISELIKHLIRSTDTLARVGGDEFCLLLMNCEETAAFSIAEKIRIEIQDYRFIWDEKPFSLGVSMGMVTVNEHSEDFEKLISLADAVCFSAKESGRNRIKVHVPDQSVDHRQEMSWVARINSAIEEDRIKLMYQTIEPISSQINDTGAHIEILMRMEENGELIPPGVFLPAAERYNLMGQVDRHIIRTTFAFFQKHRNFLRQLQTLSINLSGTTFSDPNFKSFLLESFYDYDMPYNKVCFEITESAAIINLADARPFIQYFVERGCRFSLDDFGTGFSSYGYLKQLPITYLKIDGTFVKDIVDDPVDYAMVKSMNDIANAMHKRTIAEFVENDEIIKLLKDIGVHYAQGYGISKPRPIEEFGS